MNKVNFTEENLSKIHISQFEQFLDKHGIEYEVNENEPMYPTHSGYDYNNYEIQLWQKKGDGFDVFNFGEYKYYDYKGSYTYDGSGDHRYSPIESFTRLFCEYIFLDYVQGDLTQFHVLFTQVYNEIMSYPINEIKEKE